MSAANRRHEIDALRVIALGLLIIYHIFVSYQPIANSLNFLQYENLLEKYRVVGDLLNIWRIPVLFVISGMAMGFILDRRTMGELITDRLMRLVPPLVFGSLVIVPVFPALYAIYHGDPPGYAPSPGHLWFVQNLVAYSLFVLPLAFVLKRKPDNAIIRGLRATLPLGLLLIVALPLVLESVLSKPASFAFFPIRFWYGFACYLVGFVVIRLGDRFWSSLRLVCHLALPLAVLLYLGRIEIIEWGPLRANDATTSVESGLWMIAFLGYGSLLLDRPIPFFGYLNKAVFPIYIIHMPVQQAVALVLFRWEIAPELMFLFHCLLTFAICWAVYDFGIRRLPWLYLVMGMRKAVRHSGDGKVPAPEGPRWPARAGRILTLYILTPLVMIGQVMFLIFMLGMAGRGESGDVPSDTQWRAAKNDDVAALREFLEAGDTGINEKDSSFRMTALHWAALNGSEEAVEVLIEEGADVDRTSGDRSTPVGHAALMGHPGVVKALAEGGADLNAWNQYNATALDNTHADWETVKWVAGMLGLEVEREEWEAGRVEARAVLEELGGKRKVDLRD